MIETLIEKGKAEARESERESSLSPQEKFGPPRDDLEKKTRAEGSRIDLCIQQQEREYIDLFVHIRGLSVARHIKPAARKHEHYDFATLGVEELNDIVVKGIPKRAVRSRKIMSGLYQHEYLHTPDAETIIYGTVKEIHRTFGKG